MTTEAEDEWQAMCNLAEAVAPFCQCCPECSDHPCGGVMAGGLCDAIACTCDDWLDEDDE